MSKRHYCDYTHLTLQERMTIQMGIENRSTKIAIAKTIGKDPTTVAKEIRKHRILKPRKKLYHKTICIHRQECKGCRKRENRCERYKESGCKERDRSPGSCNGCRKTGYCYLPHYFYYADIAHEVYQKTLVETRVGISIDEQRRKEIADILVPLVKKGQSFYQILVNHPEIGLSDKTLYNYIDLGVFKDFGIDSFSLKEKVQRKRFNNKYKPRKERAIYTNHTYDDYLEFIKENSDIHVVQMDTVYNSPEGPYIQTFLFENSNFMIGFVHHDKTVDSMAGTLDILEMKFGTELFTQLFPVILTDRGVEFQIPQSFQASCLSDSNRLNIFYCDPMQSTQKAQIEVNHNFIRDILPKRFRLDTVTNDDLLLVFSQINSTPRKSLNNKTPFDLFELLFSKDIIDVFGIKKLQPDDVTLSSNLLKLIKK